MNSIEKYEAIVLGGGAINGISILGALKYELEKGRYDPNYATVYAGTSIGAVISLLLICGYDPHELFFEIYNLPYFFSSGDFYSLPDIIKHMGLMSIDNFMIQIENLIRNKMGCIPTLSELYKKTSKKLVITATNSSKMRCEYYSHLTEPDMPCLKAVELSSNLPLIFGRKNYNGDCIVDGGMMDNFPISYIDDGKMKILGIVIKAMDYSLPDDGFLGYLYRLVFTPLDSNTALRCSLIKPNTKLIKIFRGTSNPFFHFTIESSKKMEMFLHGYSTAKKLDETIFIFVENY